MCGDFMNLIRSEIVIGKENVNKIKNASVLIVGLGGVGGSALEMIVRSGVENIIIIDYDKFEESNINRQIICLNDNIGEYKTGEAFKRIKKINDECKIKVYNNKIDEFFLKDNHLKVDYVIDACDDIKAKILLIKYAISNNIKIISCLGTGNKLNPSKLKISNIWKTSYDPLAKKLRQCLRKENINYKLPVVYSDEKPLVKGQKTVGSLPMVPNVAGIFTASFVINDIINNL